MNSMEVQPPSNVPFVLVADAQVYMHGVECVLVDGSRDAQEQYHGGSVVALSLQGSNQSLVLRQCLRPLQIRSPVTAVFQLNTNEAGLAPRQARDSQHQVRSGGSAREGVENMRRDAPRQRGG